SMQSLRFSLLLSALISTKAFAAAPRVTVDAGQFDRHNVVVTFALPEVGLKLAYAKAPDGKLIPIQYGPAGKASFIIPDLHKGTRQSFPLLGGAVAGPEVNLVRDKNKLKASVSGHALLEYQT